MKKQTYRSRVLALAAGCCALLLAGQQVQAKDAIFTGASGVDRNFSTTNNWSGFPVTSDNLYIGVTNNNTAGSPATVDSGWTNTFSKGAIYSKTGYGTGMVYVEVASNGLLRASNLNVGNSANAAFDGTLTLRAGGRIETAAANSGAFTIGGTNSGMVGNMIAEAGAALFRQSRLQLFKYGTLTFKFGPDSVSTLVTRRTTAGVDNTLNGLLKVDLADLTTPGSYTLIDSSTNTLLIAGALRTWLDGAGGAYSGTGNFVTNNFAVVNAAEGLPWELALADNNQDLVLTVNGYQFTAGASQDTAFRGTAVANRADLGAAAELLVYSNSSSLGVFEFDLSGADMKITNAVLRLTQTANRTGTWAFSVYAMAYTSNNYAWFEGTGTSQFGVNTNFPAAATGAACYLYRKDDPTAPLQWEDGSGTGLTNAGVAALWSVPLGSVSGTDSVAGRQITYALDAAMLEEFRTNGVGRIILGVWGSSALSGNHFYASRENANTDWQPRLALLLDPGTAEPPVITAISVAAAGGNTAATVAFDAAASASLWFTADMVYPAWSNVASGASPLGHTNSAPAGFYKVTIP